MAQNPEVRTRTTGSSRQNLPGTYRVSRDVDAAIKILKTGRDDATPVGAETAPLMNNLFKYGLRDEVLLRELCQGLRNDGKVAEAGRVEELIRQHKLGSSAANELIEEVNKACEQKAGKKQVTVSFSGRALAALRGLAEVAYIAKSFYDEKFGSSGFDLTDESAFVPAGKRGKFASEKAKTWRASLVAKPEETAVAPVATSAVPETPAETKPLVAPVVAPPVPPVLPTTAVAPMNPTAATAPVAPAVVYTSGPVAPMFSVPTLPPAGTTRPQQAPGVVAALTATPQEATQRDPKVIDQVMESIEELYRQARDPRSDDRMKQQYLKEATELVSKLESSDRAIVLQRLRDIQQIQLADQAALNRAWLGHERTQDTAALDGTRTQNRVVIMDQQARNQGILLRERAEVEGQRMAMKSIAGGFDVKTIQRNLEIAQRNLAYAQNTQGRNTQRNISTVTRSRDGIGLFGAWQMYESERSSRGNVKYWAGQVKLWQDRFDEIMNGRNDVVYPTATGYPVPPESARVPGYPSPYPGQQAPYSGQQPQQPVPDFLGELERRTAPGQAPQ